MFLETTDFSRCVVHEIDTTLRVIDYLKDEGFDVTYEKEVINDAIEFKIDIKW